MNALTIQPATPPAYTVTDIERMARAFAVSKLFGVQNPEQALALCLVAQAEGRHPASAAQDYHIINGRPSKKADAMLRDFISSGGSVKWHELSDDKADATFSHPAGGSVRITWDHARAKAAQISNPMWKKYPRQMLRSRTVSEGVRTVCPSATSGMYVPEEAQDIPPPQHVEVTSVETVTEDLPVARGPAKSSAQAKRDGDWDRISAEIAACQTVQCLREWGANNADAIGALPRAWKEQARELYGKKLEELKHAPAEEDPYALPIPESVDGSAWIDWVEALDERLRDADSPEELEAIQRANAAAIGTANGIVAGTVERVAEAVEQRSAELMEPA
jgi:hypothetical protein